jgi:hypothetical protein
MPSLAEAAERLARERRLLPVERHDLELRRMQQVIELTTATRSLAPLNEHAGLEDSCG